MLGRSGVKILDFKTSFYQHFGTPLTGCVLGDRSFWIFPPRFGGPHNLLPKVLLTSAKRLECEDAFLVLRLRMCGMYLHLSWRVSSLLCNSVFYSVSYFNVCRDEIKNNPKKSSSKGFFFGKGSDKFTTYVYAYVELCRLENTVPYTRGHCGILCHDVISQWCFHSFSVQKIDSTTAPGAYDWHINSLKRRRVRMWLKTTDTFIYWYMTPCSLNLLRLPWRLLQYTSTKLVISVCHSTRRCIAEERDLHQHYREKLWSCNNSSVRLNFNMETTIHIALSPVRSHF